MGMNMVDFKKYREIDGKGMGFHDYLGENVERDVGNPGFAWEKYLQMVGFPNVSHNFCYIFQG